MKCINCGCEMPEGNQICNICGYEPAGLNADVKPKKNVLPIIIIIVAFVAIFIIGNVMTLFIFLFAFNSTNKDFYGTWNCNNNTITLKIDKKTFIMENATSYIEAKYEVTNIEADDIATKSNLKVTSKVRKINGISYTEPTVNTYQIAINKNNKDELAMINSKTNSMYLCNKEK
ncbi:MAG: hypothetical protein J5892_01255 [Bacilli bacterium]|nr:hypothetical protein [Bacilli bacterium]